MCGAAAIHPRALKWSLLVMTKYMVGTNCFQLLGMICSKGPREDHQQSLNHWIIDNWEKKAESGWTNENDAMMTSELEQKNCPLLWRVVGGKCDLWKMTPIHSTATKNRIFSSLWWLLNHKGEFEGEAAIRGFFCCSWMTAPLFSCIRT